VGEGNIWCYPHVPRRAPGGQVPPALDTLRCGLGLTRVSCASDLHAESSKSWERGSGHTGFVHQMHGQSLGGSVPAAEPPQRPWSRPSVHHLTAASWSSSGADLFEGELGWKARGEALSSSSSTSPGSGLCALPAFSAFPVSTLTFPRCHLSPLLPGP